MMGMGARKSRRRGNPPWLPLRQIQAVQPRESIRIFAIGCPIDGILGDVLAYPIQGFLAADDVLIVVALPQSSVEPGPSKLRYAIGVPLRRHRFEPMHDIRQRQ